MSVKLRPYRKGGWEVDIHVVTPDGKRSLRERRRAKMSARSAVVRWAEGRERVLFERLVSPEPDTPKKEVPTLQAFAPRFIEGHAIANRLKPSRLSPGSRQLDWGLTALAATKTRWQCEGTRRSARSNGWTGCCTALT